MRIKEHMIHTFTQNEVTLVVDVYSGSVHVVDEQAAELIRLREMRQAKRPSSSLWRHIRMRMNTASASAWMI